MEHSVGTVTNQAISKPGKPAFVNPNNVDFDVKYPEGYKGPKYMPEGITNISKESAKLFTEMGIGKVVKEEKAVEPVKESTEKSSVDNGPVEVAEAKADNKPKGNKKK